MTSTQDQAVLDGIAAATREAEGRTLEPQAFQRMPWYGITTLPEGQYTDSTSMLEAAGLNYDVAMRPFWEYEDPKNAGDEPRLIQAKDLFRTYRLDTGKPMGAVGTKYQLVQNRQAFGFADSLLGEEQGRWVAAGEQYSGKVAFGLMELQGSQILVDGQDPFGLYLLIRTSHNGKTSIQASVITVRLMCQNQVTVSLRNAAHTWSVRHTTTLDDRMKEAQQSLKLTSLYAKTLEEELTQLVQISVSDDQARRILEEVIPQGKARREQIIGGIMNAFADTTYNGYHGTAYGLLNGVTDHFDHHIPRHNAASRFTHQVDGEGKRARDKTFTHLKALVTT